MDLRAMKFHRAFGAFAAVVLASGCAANGADKGYVIPFTEVVAMKAASNGVDYSLYVRTPPDYATSGKTYPVMVLLDADYSFAVAVNHGEHLADRGQAPEMIIVAIGYPGVYPDKAGYRLNRTRDYTPTFVENCCYGPQVQKVSGGGEKFRDFIADELLPWVDANYRTAPGRRIYVGHSFGGLFGAYVLATRPEMFSHYLLVSGSYWYDDDYVVNLFQSGEAARPDAPKKVWLGVGAYENQPALHMMVDDQRALAAALAAAGGDAVAIEQRVFEDETHASIFPAAFSTGLRRLFAGE